MAGVVCRGRIPIKIYERQGRQPFLEEESEIEDASGTQSRLGGRGHAGGAAGRGWVRSNERATADRLISSATGLA